MKRTAANIVREYGPFRTSRHVHGVSYDGANVWIATGDTLNAVDPEQRQDGAQAQCPGAGRHRLRRPAPLPDLRGPHPEDRSGERPRDRDDTGARGRRIRNGLGGRDALGRPASQPQDPSGRSAKPARSCAPSSRTASLPASPGSATNSGTVPGKASKAICAGSTPKTGEVLEQIDMPPGVIVSGLESNGSDTFFCGGGNSGKVRAVRRPK